MSRFDRSLVGLVFKVAFLILLFGVGLPVLANYVEKDRWNRHQKCEANLRKSYDPRRMVPFRSCP
jgi:hypothetical protein